MSIDNYRIIILRFFKYVNDYLSAWIKRLLGQTQKVFKLLNIIKSTDPMGCLKVIPYFNWSQHSYGSLFMYRLFNFLNILFFFNIYKFIDF